MRHASLVLLATAFSAVGASAACSSSSSSSNSDDGGSDGSLADASVTEGGSSSGSSSSSSSSSSGGASEGGTEAGPAEAGADAGDGGALAATRHVLLISVDGMHQVDLVNYIAANPTSTLAKLASTGVEYTQAHTTTPSDSFPGTLALTTGATSKTTGVYYDDSYDRTLYAPGPDGCKSADGGAGTPGTEIVFDESVDFDDSQLFSGGVNANNLPWQKDSNGNCTHVFPHNFVKVNTIFEVIKFAGGYTAWSDKHPAYELLKGPSGIGIDDLYTPEINSDPHNAPAGMVNGVALAASLNMCDGTTNSLALTKVTDYTTCEPTVQAYDDTKVNAVINWIDGKLADGSGTAPVPTIFGMNFQAVSVGEKLPVGGYKPADAGTAVPSTLLAGALAHVDASLGKMVTELTNKGLLNSTLIIVSAKHGQSPIDRSTLHMESGGFGTADVVDPLVPINTVDVNVDGVWSTFTNPNSGNPYAVSGHMMADDVGLVWLQDQSSSNVSGVLTALQNAATTIEANVLPSGTIFTSNITSGTALTAIYGDPTSTDPVASARAPNIFIQPNHGVIYSGSSKKIAEHGGGTTDDTNVLLLVSMPGLKTAQTVSTSVATTQVAPTILQALGIAPTQLQGVQKEGTAVLPSLF